MEFLLHLLTFSLLYGVVAASLSFSSGLSQLVSLAHAGFFGVGAYTSALLALKCGWSFWSSVPVVAVVAVSIGGLAALVAARAVGDTFVLVTLGLGVLLTSAMTNWRSLTRGSLGLAGIPPITVLGQPLALKWHWFLFVFVFTAVCALLLIRLTGSPLGRLLRAVGEDEVFCKSLGKDIARVKFEAFVIGSIFAATSGSVYAHYTGFIDPSAFSVHESIFILSIVTVGGMGSVLGSLAAAAVLTILPEALRFLGVPATISGNLRLMLYGFGLIGMIWWKSRGEQRER